MLDKRETAVAVQPSAASMSPAGAINLSDSWTGLLPFLQKEFGPTACKSWIAPIVPTRFEKGVLELAVATRFVRDWVRTHYADRIRQLWAQNFGTIIRVDVVVAPGAVAPAASPDSYIAKPAEELSAPNDNMSGALDPRFTFETYVVGSPNELAHAAARRVADGVTAFNPLFFAGGVGLGKTHLMHAIAWAIRARQPERRVIYMSAEKFMYQFVRALRAKETVSFKETFRAVDVLLIDDIQFLCGKESTQEEFFHTFNALVDQGKQIVVSADRPPAELEGLDARLQSRLGGGLVAQLHGTTYDLRLAILAKKRELLKRDIPDTVLAFLAEKVTANVRELEGALNRLVAHAELTNRALTLEAAEELLRDVLKANDRRVTVDDIQKKVAEHYNIRLADMHSPRRARAVARPRQIAMYLAKTLTEHSLPEIGRKFGGRDHTTIMHGIRKIEELSATDRSIQDDVAVLKRAIAG